MDAFDFIIVGAGSSGCVLAHRLSENPANRVLLIEAGPEDRSPLLTMPKGVGKVMRTERFAWQFPVEQPRIEGAASTEVWVRGRTLGGSSAINGMIYSRGHPEDYDNWSQLVGNGWDWDSMKRAFMAIEGHELGAAPARGGAGKLHVSTGKFRHDFAEACIAAGGQLGLRRKEDLNDEDQEGVGYYLHTIRNGRRFSAARAFLDAARKRANLSVLTSTLVDRVVFDGRRVRGVAVRNAAGSGAREIACRGEVILSAGAIMSPVILQHSGIGDGAQLRDLGFEVVAESRHVGRRMREHLGLVMPHRLLGIAGMNWRLRGLGLGLSVAQYYLFRSGIMANGPYEVGAFMRSGADHGRPDLQIYLGGVSFARDPSGLVNGPTIDRAPGMIISGSLLNLTSEGTVLIKSPDPSVKPSIAPNWLSTTEDQLAAVAMVRTMRRYVRQKALAPFVGEEVYPGPLVQADAEILRAVRLNAHSGLHGTGTCAMGRGEDAVLDGALRVRGVEGVRVVDLSSMPGLIAGNTNGPAQALAWRAADLILAEGHA